MREHDPADSEMSTVRMPTPLHDLKRLFKRSPRRKTLKIIPHSAAFFIFLWALSLVFPAIGRSKQNLPCLAGIGPADALIVADSDGRILYTHHEKNPCIPASTLKVLTALAAIHHLGAAYRFPTEFYTDSGQNLKVKGFGDPLLVSEIWRDIAETISKKISALNDLVLDDTYFSRDILIPGRKDSTNPYDAPVGALCANFNTVDFDRDERGKIISAESQTPLTPLAATKIQKLGLKRGRYTFSHDQREATRYAGEILFHFLKERHVKIRGTIRLGGVAPTDTLIYTYRSKFSLEASLQKMLEYSNNFMANQILLVTGARIHGPPATLAKGIDAVSGFAKQELRLQDIKIAEGSGISRKNRLSALDMLTILKKFRPYRHILTHHDGVSYKTGSLRGIRTRVGYVEDSSDKFYYFVIFLNQGGPDIHAVMKCVTQTLSKRPD